ncbi:MAG: gluconolactonase [Kiritimatiellia bacterium]|jgi:gluconolactonase
MKHPTSWHRFLALLLCVLPNPASAEDWGAFSIIPLSGPTFVLEAVGAGVAEGTVVSIGKPTSEANQKWVVEARGDKLYAIRPTYSTTLVLAAAKGADRNGAAIILEADRDQPWQRWALNRQENGSYTITPSHSKLNGLDHFGGVREAGTRIDLWQNKPGDRHLQWFIKPLAGSPIPPVVADETSSYVAPALEKDAILPGEIKSFTFSESQIFPGTIRDVTVFIPAQYDGSKPACVYVKTDGYNPREKILMETMIAGKEMPVTVGVFVRPGHLPAPMKDTQGRRNRCFEYDGVGDNKVRFLIEELLPYIAKTYALNLSTDGNDRCISGGSSGGIAAFTAAWERPDAFSRVYAASGSFVAFRGGHEYPTLVRKFEAKPIRSYLTTGMRDMENCAGDWYLLDQEMDKALKFSDYDYFFRTIDGGHVAGYMDFWQEAMAYLWKDWPERVKAGRSAPRAQDVLVPEASWEIVSEAYQGITAAACNAAGEVFFADPTGGKIHEIDLDGKISMFANAQANGLTVSADDKLYTVSRKSGKVMCYDRSGKASLVLDGLPGHAILALPNNDLYVTSNAEDTGSVWHIRDGEKTRVDSGLKRATGLAYRPDQWLLSVADGDSKWVYSYQITEDGSLTHKERFFWLHVQDWQDNAGAESIGYAREGQQFIATRAGIQVSADDGPTQVILPLPDHSAVTAVCLGGRAFDTLFAFSGDTIWKRTVKVHAVGAFTPWTKVNGTRL